MHFTLLQMFQHHYHSVLRRSRHHHLVSRRHQHHHLVPRRHRHHHSVSGRHQHNHSVPRRHQHHHSVDPRRYLQMKPQRQITGISTNSPLFYYLSQTSTVHELSSTTSSEDSTESDSDIIHVPSTEKVCFILVQYMYSVLPLSDCCIRPNYSACLFAFQHLLTGLVTEIHSLVISTIHTDNQY